MDYELKLSQQHLQVINDALMQLPYYVAAPLIAHINKELEKQKQIMDTPIDESDLAFSDTHPPATAGFFTSGRGD